MLEGTFGPDRAAIRRLHRRDPSAAAELARDSRERVLKRTLDTPEIAFPAELPFSSRVDDIRSAIESSRVVILSGETGSGKSTQLPKLCLAMGRGAAGLIGHTQPRRLAARSVAARVASELGGTVGGLVGAKVRFGDDTSAETRIKLMTDGVLLAESRRDRDLEQYDTIIVDEAHERSLNIDFLLGLLCRVVGRRDDLKIIVTSATIDAQRFADHFEQALHERVPVIEVSGRTYPVDIVHREPVDDDGWPLDLPDAIADAAERLAVRDGFGSAGDVLVFLPGEREIRDAARRLREAGETSRLLSGCEIVPLYARLGMAEQQRVFRRAARRKIVLATNVAETSLTVPGIRYVIDSGVARISRYSTRRRVQSLQVEPISRASARQRAGRCGRTEDGVCIRLFSEADHEARPEFTQPEIQRTNLAGVILQMAELGLGRPEDFPFVDPPDRRRIAEAYDTLRELSAVDADDAITAMGRRLARLPVDPRIGRILVEADELGVLAEALIVASALECQDPRLRPHEQRDAADASHQRFADPASDFIAILRLWDHYHKLKDSLSRAALRRTLEREFLSLVRMREWTDTHRQLRDMVNEIGLRPRRRRDDPAALHRAVLAGFATSVGRKEPNGTFASPLAGRFAIHPASCVRTKGSSWLVVTELLRTTRLFARTAARVDAAWIEHAARHLIRREYGEPMYNPDRGVVEAPSSAWLGQLELSRERLVPYASVDREHARRVFLEQALVDGALRCGAPFETHNAALLAELTDEEAKLRTPRTPTHDMLVGFFDARLPPDVCTARGFDRFRRRTEAEDPTALLMRREDFLDATQDAPDPHGAPESIDLGAGSRARLTYRFEPGSETDGIAAELTLSDAASANADTFEWLVPALLAEKVRAVLTGLPRRVRRQIDLDRTTDAVTSSLRFREGNFFQAVADAVSRQTRQMITAADCRAVELPPHLRMMLRVVGDEGTVAEGRDHAAILGRSREAWAERVRADRSQRVWAEWPTNAERIEPPEALQDNGGGVVRVTCPDAASAVWLHRFGCRRLVGLGLLSEVDTLLGHLPDAPRVSVLHLTVPDAPPLAAELAAVIAEADGTPAACTTRDELGLRLDRARGELADRLGRAVSAYARALEARQAAELRLADGPAGDVSRQDMHFQLAQLIHAGTLRSIEWERLLRLSAYVRGIGIRLDRLRSAGAAKDAASMRQVLPHWQRCIAAARDDERLGRYRPAVRAYRWAIEEYRLTLFAPGLAQRGAASTKRLDELAARLG